MLSFTNKTPKNTATMGFIYDEVIAREAGHLLRTYIFDEYPIIEPKTTRYNNAIITLDVKWTLETSPIQIPTIVNPIPAATI